MQAGRTVPLVAALVGFMAVWEAGGPLLASRSHPAFLPKSFYGAPGAEPIAPLPAALPLDQRKVTLGKRLFRDSRLSHDNSISCASCHDLAKGGADGLKHSVGIRGQVGERNAPTVFNTVFNFRQFWDGRAASLEEQIDGPVQDSREMASNWTEIVAKLKADADYAVRFDDIYGRLGSEQIKNAIAEYERSLITPSSRFDRYLRGSRDAISAQELKGYELFKSYGCAACHQGVNVGGNLYERLGVMVMFFKDASASAATNLGREAVTGRAEDRHVFKVPSLRNVALTAPYFHDGSVATLEQAVLIMGRYQLAAEIPLQDVQLIVKFLNTLTGEFTEAVP